MSGQTSPTVAERLAARLLRPVAAEDRERATLHVVDWTGCAVAAAQSAPARAMRRIFPRTEDFEGVMYWGALGNVLEMDDVDKRALLHPGPVVIPAALVGCDLYQCDAATFLDAIVRGYEAMIRVGRAVGPGHYKFWHNTSSCGPFGAAAGLAASVPRDDPRIADALGLAGTQAAGFWQTRHEPLSMAKQLHAARAAHAGLAAFALADEGFIGIRTIFEGPQGFFAATCPGADPGDVVAFEEDASWAIFDVSFKPWAACRHAHAVIDAALALRDKGVVADDVESLLIRVYADAVTFCDKP
ncbi:MAG: MmgE/PrpD family protein, partial [Parvularculaceae bacterium]|nr:MmgE/PrpD family protein [Parvularculaceae bacterium]